MNGDPDIPPMSRILAALLFLGLCAVVAAVYVVGFLGLSDTWNAIVAGEQQLDAFESRLAQGTGGATAPAAEPSALFAAPTPAVAAASMQQLAGAIVAAAGGVVREVQVLPPDDTAAKASGPVPVSTEFRFETTHPGLWQILSGISAASPLLKTDMLSIEALNPPAPGAPEIPLRVDLRITGYWSGGGA